MKKKLIVKQVDESDCGPCCLLSIIRYFNGNVPLELLKIDTNTSKLGTNAYDIILAANKYGLEGKGIKTKDIINIPLPIIAHLKIDEYFYHFVVIYEIKKDYLIIMDPALGKVKINKTKFNNLFTGNLIYLIPTTEITYLKTKPTLNKIIKLFFKTNKKDLLKLYLIEFVLLSIVIINSFNLKLISTNIKIFTLIFICCLIIQSILSIKKTKIVTTLKSFLKLNLTKNFFSHILLLPLKFIQLKSNGEILTRFKELNLVSEFIINILFKNIIESIICLAIILIIFIINPKIGLLITITSLGLICISYLLNKYINPKITKEINNEVDYNSKLNEYINSLETIKILNNYSYFHNKFNLNLKEKIVHTIKLEKLLTIESILKNFLISFVYLMLIYYSLRLKITFLNIITLLNLANIFFDTLKSFLNDFPYFYYQKNIFIKLNEFFSLKEEKLKIKQLSIFPSIKFQNVTFTYNNIKKLNYNFIIHANSFVMIKGKNGSGKSTICKLLTKILTNYEGDILINDKNIKDYSELEIRNIISYSNQSSKLFKDTVKNNIILNRNINNEKFEEIAKICDLESVVSDKINRYDSIIYENSPNFSGGEIQKIILARTLISDSKIIILDETLSAVNNSTEIKIINNLKRYLKNKTIIYITHKNLEKYFDYYIELERK